jgi:hypothetical protein
MRLTKSIREHILRNALADLFDEMAEKHNAEVNVLVKTAFEEYFAEELETISTIPKEKRERIIGIYTGIIEVRLTSGEEKDSILLLNSRGKETSRYLKYPLPYGLGIFRDRWNQTILFSEKDIPKTYDMFKKINEKTKEIASQISLAKNQIKAILDSVTTDKKLIELAPELEKYLPKPEPAPSNILPIDLINSVRALLQGNKK